MNRNVGIHCPLSPRSAEASPKKTTTARTRPDTLNRSTSQPQREKPWFAKNAYLFVHLPPFTQHLSLHLNYYWNSTFSTVKPSSRAHTYTPLQSLRIVARQCLLQPFPRCPCRPSVCRRGGGGVEVLHVSREEEGILQGDAGSLGEDGVELGREGDTRPVAAAVEANRQGMDE